MFEDDDGERRRRTLVGGFALLVVLAVGLWIANLVAERQRLERCIAEGRRGCMPVPSEPRPDYPPSR
jgi:hypothetical protein